jgi:hypothetical protein
MSKKKQVVVEMHQHKTAYGVIVGKAHPKDAKHNNPVTQAMHNNSK